MTRSVRLRPGVIRLPVADVAALVRIMNDPKTRAALTGVRRQTVDQVCKKLARVVSNQVDGQVELDATVVVAILNATAEAVEWIKDLFDDYFDGDERT